MGKTVKVKAKTKATVKHKPTKIRGGDSGLVTGKMVIAVRRKKK